MVASTFKFVMINKIIFNPLWSLFMKKLVNLFKKPVVAAGVFGLMVAGSAGANVDCLKFYAGAGVDYNNYGRGDVVKDFKTHKTNGMGLAVPVLGMKFHENFGVEIGYSFNKKFKFQEDKKANANAVGLNTNFDVKVKNAYIDLMGFMPLSEQFDLIGGIGLGHLRTKFSNKSVSASVPGTIGTVRVATKSKTSWRVKLGAQYNVNNNFGIRALATYQHAGNKMDINRSMTDAAGGNIANINNSGSFVKNMKSLGLAAIYTF